ncbi:MAG: HlyD family efflux transporter periplasmic adaptor subunit [Anaerolineae bacterium]|nr:HlyD family efflux transporter periplasmic adaptor subunit [Anaerolineae bacterium]
MKTSKWILTLITAAVLLTGCSAEMVQIDGTPEAGADADVTPYPTLPPAPGGKAVAADGKLASPYPSVEMSFGGEASGEVLSIEVKAGDAVEAGDLLATLADTELQRAVDEAQLALDRAIADREDAVEQWEQDVADAEKTLADAERELTNARLEFSDTDLEEARVNLKWAQRSEKDRKEEYEKARVQWPPMPIDEERAAWERAIDDLMLAEKRLADAEEAYTVEALKLRGYEADVVEAERDRAALESGIEASYDREIEDARIELAKAEEDLAHARITAPWAAIVLSVDAVSGVDVDAGTSIVTLLNVEDGLRFVTQDLSEQHIADVYVGQRAVVTLRTFAGEPLEGTVEAVVPQVEETEEADARFTIYVQLTPTDLRLLPGLTGRVEIYTQD